MTLIKVKERGRETVNLGRRNIVINGAMQVAQRGTSFTGLGGANTYEACDRFLLTSTGTNGRLTYSQGVDAPHDQGFRNSIKLACTTADTSIAAGEFTRIRHRIEGRDVQQIGLGTSGAKPITVSFYVKGNAAATYVCELQDHDNNKIATKSFTVGTTWNRVEITFPAETSGNKFDNDVNTSLTISWVLHAGSNFTSGTFDNTATFATLVDANRALSGQTSFFDSTNRTFFLTGVQLETGDVATEFEHRSFGEELAACQRYYNRIGFYNQRVRLDNRSSQNPDMTNTITFPTMRDAPTMNTYTDSAYTTSGTTVNGGATLAFGNISSSSANASLNSNSSGAGTIAGACYLELDSEL